MNIASQQQSFAESFKALMHPKVIALFFLGFSAGLPILLIFSSLSLWLGEAGVSRKAVTFFSWAALGYSFKFIWAPLIDKLPIPLLTNFFGRRRAWLFMSQISVITAICLMAITDPAADQTALTQMALAAVMLGFSSATQDIVIDAYRIEIAPRKLQALLASSYIAGYRVGMVVAGAGALFLASYFGTEKGNYVFDAWRNSYFIMAGFMGLGVLTTFLIAEPEKHRETEYRFKTNDYLRILLLFAAFVGAFILVFVYAGQLLNHLTSQAHSNPVLDFIFGSIRMLSSLSIALIAAYVLALIGLVRKQVAYETWVLPISDFFQRYGLKTALLLLLLVGLYRISDIVPGVISNVFYQDLGYSKNEIATAVKLIGVWVSILGGFLGGIFANRYGVMRILIWGAVLTSITNLVFVILAQIGYNIPMLYLAIIIDNLAAGFASAVFVAFLSALTSVQFTAVQYAVFSSLMTLFPKVLGGYSGSMVDSIGYPYFFTFTMLIGLPIIVLCIMAAKHLQVGNRDGVATKE